MKKKLGTKLALHRETLRRLEGPALEQAAGAASCGQICYRTCDCNSISDPGCICQKTDDCANTMIITQC